MASVSNPVLVVDDDLEILRSTSRLLEEGFQFRCLAASTAKEALEIVARQAVGLVLLDLGLPDLDGAQVLSFLRRDYPGVPVIVVTALGEVESAVQCMASGAYDYVVKGSDPGRLINSVKRALESREKDLAIAALRDGIQATGVKRPESFSDIVTVNEHIRGLFRFIEVVAASDEPILLQGETGTGKELFARAIHKASGAKGPFVATNLGGLEDLLVSDTLFGHVKGAYTGADGPRKGLVFQASGGTLFLDEIGDLSAQSQVKLLRFLENGEYFPLGTDLGRRSEARVVAATNMDLEARAVEGLFRRDLLYRLSTYRVDIPPLRDRKEDIPLLCQHFLSLAAEGSPPPSLTPGALATLGLHSFPGNIRELRGLLLKAKALKRGPTIDHSVIEKLLAGPLRPTVGPALPVPSGASGLPTIQQAVADLIQDALKRTNGHQTMAAKLLGISPQALSKRLRQRESGL